jgi:hypothetical protein
MDPEHFSEPFQRVTLETKSPDSFNLNLGNYSPAIFFARYVCTVCMTVMVIFGFCSPFKVGHAVFITAAVAMAGFLTWGPRSHKNYKNELVDKVMVLFSTFPQVYLKVAAIIFAWAQDSLGMAIQNHFAAPAWQTLPFPVRAYPATVAYFISREPRNIFPDFIRTVKVAFSHGVALLDRVCAEVGAVAAITPLRPVYFYHRPTG